MAANTAADMCAVLFFSGVDVKAARPTGSKIAGAVVYVVAKGSVGATVV